MWKEILHTEDVMAMVVGLRYPSAFQRYMIARQNAVIHKIAEVNTLLERTFGVLLYTEDLISLCVLAGIGRKEAKMLRDFEYLSCKQRDRLKDEFIDGFQKLGYSRESIYPLFYYVAYTAKECIKREYVVASVKNYISQASQLMFK